jgi:hypothetical protein
MANAKISMSTGAKDAEWAARDEVREEQGNQRAPTSSQRDGS